MSTAGEPARLLVVDDLEVNRELLARRVSRLGHTAGFAVNGVDALDKLRSEPWDLVLLDITMPEMDGYEVLRQLKSDPALADIPVVMVSAIDETDSMVRCLELGADDYLTKPFSLAELLARVKALLRRADLLAAAQENAQTAGRAAAIRNGELEILPAKRQVRCRGALLDFTALEFDLLLHFASHPGHVFSRAQLLNAVWGYTHDGYEHTVTTHINRLRAKLEADPMRPEIILTARGAGYKMRDTG